MARTLANLTVPTPNPPDILNHDFQAKLEKWKADWRSSLADNRWTPTGAAARMVALLPPPVWTGSERANPFKVTSAVNLILKEIGIRNAAFLKRQRVARKAFFDSVEKNPRTEEQIHACVCMDDHVLVVAAAGSRKTSTMVAKTGYVLLTIFMLI
jgi:DNA helicase-4